MPVTEAYVYGVTRRRPADIRCKGVAGSDVYAVEYRDLAALVSDVPGSVRAKRRDLMSHSDVIQSAFANGTIIPFRFGTMFDARESVEKDLLAGRYDDLLSLIDELDGLAELRLRATYVPDAVLSELVHEVPEVARLRGRAGAEAALGEAVANALAAKRDAEAAALVRELSTHARDVVVDEPQSDYELVRASFLVAHDEAERFDDVAGDLAARRAGTAVFTVVGPLPPHSFARFEGR
ncbi:MAG TPA: GvpL/GvpF family gas vesicle protein [Gaiellaceae bacterium]|nr:GvpL/GvpF family gas vesicle protein [Gaiellaceae bacterium]